jgi:hypothetical protein
MKQHEAVILTLERLGGQATLGQLYREVMTVQDCRWVTKTPFASIRRIVQTRPEIFKVRPGLWALESHKGKLGLQAEGDRPPDEATAEQGHAFYQRLLAEIGNLRGLRTFVPNQDKNKLCVAKPLDELRTMKELPLFPHAPLVKRLSTVDVSWFNQRLMPDSLFEVEHSTDIHTSLLKFHDLRDFHARMVVVAHVSRKAEFQYKISMEALREIRDRVAFFDYGALARAYEHEAEIAQGGFAL